MKSILTLSILILSIVTTQAQWTTNGPFGAFINEEAMIGNTMYVSVSTGIYKSDDNCNTWQLVRSNVDIENYYRIFFHAGTLYGARWSGNENEIWVSTDTGKTWTVSNPPSWNQTPTYMFTACPYGVVAATGQGIYLTLNNGISWQTLNRPNINVPSYYGVWFHNNQLIVMDGYYGKMYLSTDTGSTWVQATGSEFNFMFHIDTIGSDLYAFGDSIWRSVDYGYTWSRVIDMSIGGGDKNICRVGKTYYISHGGNTNVTVWKINLPNPSNWINITSNLPDGQTSVVFNIGNTVFIGKDDVLFKTTDGGSSWVLSPLNGMTGVDITAILADGNNLFAGSYNKLFRSTDNGNTWEVTGASLPYTNVHSLYKYGQKIMAGTSDGMIVSADNGTTWPTKYFSQFDVFAIGGSGNQVFANADAAVYKSINGTSWPAFNNGIPGNVVATSMYVKGNQLFGGFAATSPPYTDAGVYKTDTSTANWVKKSDGLSNYSARCFTHIGSTLFAGNDNGVYQSTDDGDNWTLDNTGMENREVNALLAIYNTLIAATDSGVYTRQGTSGSWTHISANLPYSDIKCLAANNDYLFAGAVNGSVWQIPSVLVGTHEPTNDPVITVLPNPTSGLIRVEGIYEPGILSVYGMDGKILIRHNDSMADISRLPGGLYVVEWKTNQNLARQKVIKL